MRVTDSLGAARLEPALPAPRGLEMRIVDARKLRQALLRLCSGKQFTVEPAGLPVSVLVGPTPAFVR